MIFKTIIKRIFKITLTTKINLWLMIGTFATDVIPRSLVCGVARWRACLNQMYSTESACDQKIFFEYGSLSRQFNAYGWRNPDPEGNESTQPQVVVN